MGLLSDAEPLTRDCGPAASAASVIGARVPGHWGVAGAGPPHPDTAPPGRPPGPLPRRPGLR